MRGKDESKKVSREGVKSGGGGVLMFWQQQQEFVSYLFGGKLAVAAAKEESAKNKTGKYVLIIERRRRRECGGREWSKKSKSGGGGYFGLLFGRDGGLFKGNSWKINLCSDFRYFSLPTSSFMYLVVPRAKEHVLLLSRCKIFRNFYKGLCDIFSKTREASMSLFTLKLEGREQGNHGM